MDIEIAREQMIDQQIRAWDVLQPRVLRILGEVPRERFVPGTWSSLAFADTEIPLAHGENMMAPKVEGRLLQALEIEPGDRVLEVGTGTGFLTACLAHLGEHVVSVDCYSDFVATAGDRLREMEIRNTELLTMDAIRELPAGEFDAIAVTGSVPRFEQRFADALAIDGRLFLVVGEAPVMEALLVTRTGENEWSRESLFETVLKPLRNATPPPEFRF
ncbi:MAG TPA: protein-L-isoaspartate O-methyltransferase [Woeseiaceae bacterium]|nr:protein-L-isoaspartate O-methyltransferase [Woeseiaceae bacterium]